MRRAYEIVRGLTLFLLSIASGRSTLAVDFQWHWDPRLDPDSDVRTAADQAAGWWQAVLADSVQLQVEIKLADSSQLGPLTLASTEYGFAAFDYPILRHALEQDATSAADRMAVRFLPVDATLAMRTRAGDGQTIVAQGTANWNHYVTVTSANAKALGLDPELANGEVDGRIVINADWLAEMQTDSVRPLSQADLTLLLAHELGHVLGFQSGVDQIDLSVLPNGPLAPFDLHGFSVIHTLDLMRYSPESLPLIDMAPGGTPYFSLNGGLQPLAYFATGEFNGDGWQASHWRQGQGLMEAAQSGDAGSPITHLDQLAMDAIGWDLASFVCGDFEGDQDVDSADLAVLIGHWTGTREAGLPQRGFFQGDCDGDHDVDSADLAGLIGNWTGVRSWGPAPVVHTASEPSTCSALLALLITGPWRARRTRPRNSR
jgi:hypothetical protein